MGRRSSRPVAGPLRAVARAVALAAVLLAVPATALAHPLGNFTINHSALLTVTLTGIDVDVVIDMAEIPTFQERQRMDANADGEVSDAEFAGRAEARCSELAGFLELAVDGRPMALEAGSAELTFPAGTGGLPTLRLACRYDAPFDAPIATETTITFADRAWDERLGWREILASGDGVELDTGGLPADSPSARLTAYPEDRLETPLDVRTATLVARPATGGSGGPSASADPAVPPGGAGPNPGGGAIPGVGEEIPGIFAAVDLTPLVALLSLATAIGLGAVHALTPGHGKTLMAAYLVGTRGTAVHAVGLGLSVTVSHTLGILALAALIAGAEGLLPPETVVRAAPLVAAVTIVAIGGWMLVSEIRRRRSAAPRVGDVVGHGHGHGHDHGHDHDHEDRHARDHEHEHGGRHHSHLPPTGSTITWRSLFALGLAGGLIPSTSALLILLGSIATGRTAFGVVLVIAFGLGMAVVLGAVGLLMVVARGRLETLPRGTTVARLAGQAPLVAAVVVLSLGVYLAVQAVAGATVL